MGNKLGYPEVDLSGKVAVVTGGNAGIGYETAKALARLGAHTIIACRSKEKAVAAIEQMKKELAQPIDADKDSDAAESSDNAAEGSEKNKIKVEFLQLDLASFQSTAAFVAAFKEKNLPLHILVNNAAIFGVPYAQTGDNLESQLQVNHLSPLLLTLELLPILLETAASSGDVRIVFVSSTSHFQAPGFNPGKLDVSQEEYGRITAYSRSKLYTVMTGFALQRRLSGKNITISSLNPGFVKTDAGKGLQDNKFLYYLQRSASRTIGRSPAKGAATSIYCAVNPDLNSQQHFYYDSCQPKQSSADSRNEKFQEQMWEKSFEFLKEHLSAETVEKYGPKKPEATEQTSD